MGNTQAGGQAGVSPAELRRLEANLSPEELRHAKDAHASVLASAASNKGNLYEELSRQFRLEGFDLDPNMLAGAAMGGTAASVSESKTLKWEQWLSCLVAVKTAKQETLASQLVELCCRDDGLITASTPQMIKLAKAAFSASTGIAFDFTLDEFAALSGADDPSSAARAMMAPSGSSPAASDEAKEASLQAMSTEGAQRWLERVLPGLVFCLRDFFLWCFLGRRRPVVATNGNGSGSSSGSGPGHTSASLPLLVSPEDVEGVSIYSAGMAWSLLMLLGPGVVPAPTIRHVLLYRQSLHGYSSNIFSSRVDGYPGPVIVLFSIEIPRVSSAATRDSVSQSDGAERQAVVGAMVDASLFTPLGLSAKGSSKTRLLSVQPQLMGFGLKGSSPPDPEQLKHQAGYFSGHSRRAQRAGAAAPHKGFEGFLGFGGTASDPRLELEEEADFLVLRRAVKADLFQSGPLIAAPEAQGFAPLRCKVLEFEVWGLGGASALREQAAAQEREDRFVQQRKKVDLASFADDWENNPDREILGLGTSGSQQQQARGHYTRGGEKGLDQRDLQQP